MNENKKWLASCLLLQSCVDLGRKINIVTTELILLPVTVFFVRLVVYPLELKLCEDVYEHLHLGKIFINICIWFVTQKWYLMVTINVQIAIFFQR